MSKRKEATTNKVALKKSKTSSKQSGTASARSEELQHVQEEKYTFFYSTRSPFSQHHPAEFRVDGIDYVNAEQYMMHQKAVLFGDDEIATQILRESLPQIMKKLGRKVKGFDEQCWGDNRIKIVKKANYAKFSQNPNLMRQLLDTDGTVLVEAAATDTIWGIGLRANHPKAKTKKTWRGRNLLGYILTEVRDELKQERSDKTQTSGKEME